MIEALVASHPSVRYVDCSNHVSLAQFYALVSNTQFVRICAPVEGGIISSNSYATTVAWAASQVLEIHGPGLTLTRPASQS